MIFFGIYTSLILKWTLRDGICSFFKAYNLFQGSDLVFLLTPESVFFPHLQLYNVDVWHPKFFSRDRDFVGSAFLHIPAQPLYVPLLQWTSASKILTVLAVSLDCLTEINMKGFIPKYQYQFHFPSFQCATIYFQVSNKLIAITKQLNPHAFI